MTDKKKLTLSSKRSFAHKVQSGGLVLKVDTLLYFN